VKIDSDLNVRFFKFFLPSFFTNLLTTGSRAKKKSVCQIRNEVKNISKVFSTKKWVVSSVEGQCKMQKTNAIERSQTARSELNYRHVSELICSQEGNIGSSGSPREMINLKVISVSCEKLSWTQTRYR